MPAEEKEAVELLDLKMLPAWVKEAPEPNAYAHYEGDTGEKDFSRGGRRDGRDAGRTRRPPRPDSRSARPDGRGGPRDRSDRPRPQRSREGDRGPRPGRREEHAPRPERPPLQLPIRFLPHPPALASVTAQIKADLLAYSVFSLARLFLQKPERYDVHVAAKPETPLFQLGEHGPISSDRAFLESNAFRLVQGDYYKVESTQSEPVKGNFTSVARHRPTGILLGPTNHHAYQPRLRTLYDQKFSRRMSFPDFQRQIEIVTDPALVEQWKEEARTVTTFTTSQAEPPLTFNTVAEAERHFRANYLGNAIRQIEEVTMDGNTSRGLADRPLRGAIEEAWTAQTRSPSQMMAELSTRLREAGLNIFRHRKGMLFVSPIRVRTFAHEQTSVSTQVRAIIDLVSSTSRINRKDLAEKILAGVSEEEAESRKLALASDLRWLVSEGFVIEFNDSSLDLPRAKVKPAEAKEGEAKAEEPGSVGESPLETSPAESEAMPTAEAGSAAEAEVGGS